MLSSPAVKAEVKTEEGAANSGEWSDSWLKEYFGPLTPIKKEDCSEDVKQEPNAEEKSMILFLEHGKDFNPKCRDYPLKDSPEKVEAKRNHEPERKAKRKVLKGPKGNLLKNDLLLRKILERATITNKSLDNQCVFKCVSCSFQTSSWVSLTKHNKCGRRFFGFADVGKVISKAVGFQCKICRMNVLCDSSFIVRHVRNHHPYIGMEKFRSKHSENVSEGAKNETKTVSKYAVNQWRANKNLELDAIIGRVIESASKSTNGLKSQCIFCCPECKMNFTSWTYFLKHKGCIRGRSMDLIGSVIVKAVFFHCQLCQRKVLCDANFIQRHKSISHPKMSASDYRQEHDKRWREVIQVKEQVMQNAQKSRAVGNLCTFVCRECKQMFYSSGCLVAHCKEKDHAYSTCDLYKYLFKVVLHDCALCSKLILCDSSMLKSHVERVHKMSIKTYCSKSSTKMIPNSSRAEQSTNNWTECRKPGNLCLFTCPVCKCSKTSWLALKHHFKKESCKKKPFAMKDYLTKTVLYRCKLCDKRMYADWYTIKSHAMWVHKLTREEFDSRCVTSE